MYIVCSFVDSWWSLVFIFRIPVQLTYICIYIHVPIQKRNTQTFFWLCFSWFIFLIHKFENEDDVQEP